MGKKWKVKRGFVKMDLMADTQTLKITAESVLLFDMRKNDDASAK